MATGANSKIRARLSKELEVVNESAAKWTDKQFGSHTMWTAEVKSRVGKIGEGLGYRVRPSDTAGAESGEWLYDLTWLKPNDGDPKLFERIILALECEWDTRPHELLRDFQKLVFSKAEFCVMVWQGDAPDRLRKDVDIFHQQVKLARDNVSRYLFAGWDRKQKEFKFF